MGYDGRMKLREIDGLVTRLFSERWSELHSPASLKRPSLQYPGVYLLAYTAAKLNDRRVAARDVFYVGMSNSASGVRQRLKQFKVGIEKDALHSGARRFYRDYCQNRPFTIANTGKRFYL
jgi:hypothetical protein